MDLFLQLLQDNLETTAAGSACRAWCLLKIQACFQLSRRHPPRVLRTPGPGVTTGWKNESYCTVNLCTSLLLAVLKAKTRVHTAPHRRDELFFITMTQQWKVFCKVFSSQPEGKHSVCLSVFNSEIWLLLAIWLREGLQIWAHPGQKMA